MPQGSPLGPAPPVEAPPIRRRDRLDPAAPAQRGPEPMVVWGQLWWPCSACGAPVSPALASGALRCGACGAEGSLSIDAWAPHVAGPAFADCLSQRPTAPGYRVGGPWLRLSRGDAACGSCQAPWSDDAVDGLIGGLAAECGACGASAQLGPPPAELLAQIPGLRLSCLTESGGIVLVLELSAGARWRALLADRRRRRILVDRPGAAPLGLLRRLLRRLPAHLRGELAPAARRPALQRALARDLSAEVRANLLCARRLDPAVIDLLIDDEVEIVLNNVAGRPDLSPSQGLALARRLAAGPPPRAVEGRTFVTVLNSALGERPAERLAAGRLLGELPAEALDLLLSLGDERVIRALARNPLLPEAALLRWVDRDDAAAQRVLAAHAHRLPDADQDRLLNAEDWSLRELLGANPGLDAERLQRLGRDPSLLVRLSVARNPAAPLGTLQRLGRADNAELRAEARANPGWAAPSPLERLRLMFGLRG
jgi:hypothetical protein